MDQIIEGSCHCGSVNWKVLSLLNGATSCNCTICRRYGALWGYGHSGVDIHISGESAYYRREGVIDFHFCKGCGCLTHYRAIRLEADGKQKVAVNLRMVTEPAKIENLNLDRFDGLDSFEDLPSDGRRVKDLWF